MQSENLGEIMHTLRDFGEIVYKNKFFTESSQKILALTVDEC